MSEGDMNSDKISQKSCYKCKVYTSVVVDRLKKSPVQELFFKKCKKNMFVNLTTSTVWK